jgi:hypothetical protein
MTTEMDELETALIAHRSASSFDTAEPEEGPLSDGEKAWLIDSNWAAQYAQGDSEISEISAHLESYRSGSQHLFPIKAEVKLEPNWRSIAFAEVSAIDAARDPAVVAFRADVLEGRLIAFEDIKTWAETTAQQEGRAVGLVTIPDDTDRIPRSPEEAKALEVKASWTAIVIRFPDAAGSRVKAVRIRLGGVLDRLRGVAMHLGLSYGWKEPYAVAFILTGESPPPLRGSVTASRTYGSLRPSTATITVNPDWVSPSDVARLYREVMSEDDFRQHGGEPGAGRPLQEKSARLAVFAARHAGSGSWAELMARWNVENSENSGWEYSDRRRFGRDCRRAYERVAGQSLEVRDAQSEG